MRIVMVGHSGAGKTTYVSLMYEQMNKGYKHFTIHARSDDHHRELLGAAYGIRHGRYPLETSRRDVYAFDLRYRGSTFFTFTWHDYRGGALSERSTEADAAAVLSDLRGADGVVVFADAFRAATEPVASREARRLANLAQGALTERRGRVPFVIAYTKADRVGRRMWPAALAPYASLDLAARTSSNVHGTSVRVKCTRRPDNVHIPVLWCLGYGITELIEDLRAAAESHKRDSDRYWDNAGIRDSYRAWRDGTKSNRTRAIEASDSAAKALAEIQPLAGPAMELIRVLRRAHKH